jgi:Rrf2 family transcriptional regulator, nitric oxide-sensitive transcriptional repressor
VQRQAGRLNEKVRLVNIHFKYMFALASCSVLMPACPAMRLSAYSDFSIRVLIHAALRDPARVTVDEVAVTFGISRHHLVKVVHDLGRNGYLATHRGVGGGFTLARSAAEICLGDIVRHGEETDTVIDCVDGRDRPCRLLPCCRLKGVLDEAAAAFFEVLDGYTLADLLKQQSRMRTLLAL